MKRRRARTDGKTEGQGAEYYKRTDMTDLEHCHTEDDEKTAKKLAMIERERSWNQQASTGERERERERERESEREARQ